MNNILNLNPRLEAARTARLSEIRQGRVISDKALELISESLSRLEPEIATHDDNDVLAWGFADAALNDVLVDCS